ncbi:helix-turn-helix domain-containing protein [Microbacterium sp. UFMG61]|uniref:helix-turn-helix domain-containing protein n=1 Tax=Microbacterium sp. UFMG61 TaxID=2745935 RepID=UPI003A5C67D3
MDASGRSAREIAVALGVSARTVTRWRRAMGRSRGGRKYPTPPSVLQAHTKC